jgi:hypothetical protein
MFSMLDLLSQVCDTLSSSDGKLPSASHRNSGEDYKGFLAVLDWRIRTLPISKVKLTDDDTFSPPFTNDDGTLVMQLYQLAILLFFNRSVEDIIEPHPIRMQQHIEKAFAILPRLFSGCKAQFPIYIIGCEARTDVQRAIILDAISRTEEMSSSRSWNSFKRILQATWAQDDLANADDNINYRERLSLVLSHCMIVPCFV